MAPPAEPRFQRVRVVVADPYTLSRTSVAGLLAAHPMLTVVGEAATASEVLRAVAREPAVVLAHPHLSEDLSVLIRTVRLASPPSPVVLFGLREDEQRIAAWLQAGASGFIDEKADLAAVVDVLLRVAAGERVISPRLSSPVEAAAAGPAPPPGRREPARPAWALLTERERQVLRLVAAGCSNRDAARVLGISEHTVRAHLRGISQKLGVQNRLQAVALAFHTGLLDAGGGASALQPSAAS
jgi:two-component system nitrate/nitrite response regulator NarL